MGRESGRGACGSFSSCAARAKRWNNEPIRGNKSYGLGALAKPGLTAGREEGKGLWREAGSQGRVLMSLHDSHDSPVDELSCFQEFARAVFSLGGVDSGNPHRSDFYIDLFPRPARQPGWLLARALLTRSRTCFGRYEHSRSRRTACACARTS